MHRISDKIIAWLDPTTIEPQAKTQLHNIAELPFIFDHIAVMPDCHLGKGATVGSVIATKGAIIPAAVGVDIGCGMIAVKTKFFSSQLPDNLRKIREGIEEQIPVSAGGYHKIIPKTAERRLAHLRKIGLSEYDNVDPRWPIQLGTLGSGNHFIEICLDEQEQVWAVLHSGSRGIGNRLATRHIQIAQRLMAEQHVALKDKDLAYLQEGLPEFDAYIRDLLWAQEFARLNREEMMDQVMAQLSLAFCGERGHEKEIELDRINCHHNFTQREVHFETEVWLTRKGAIQMKKGQRGIIPGSMGARSYIVSGLENPFSFHSAPHGAGRRFSRGEARRRFTMEQLEERMRGIECRLRPALVDEIDDAYKSIVEVMKNSEDLVSIEHVLKQVLNIKGD